MTYDPNLMPQNMDEWQQLIDYKVEEAQSAYEAEVETVRASVIAQYASLPDEDDRPALEDFVAAALATVPLPLTRADFERTYACYKPQIFPE